LTTSSTLAYPAIHLKSQLSEKCAKVVDWLDELNSINIPSKLGVAIEMLT
jgi:hypothetical protein